MYLIEFPSDKCESMQEHLEKGLRHLGKLMVCFDEMMEKHNHRNPGAHEMEEDDDDFEDEEDEDYKKMKHFLYRMAKRRNHRGGGSHGGSGRYGNY